MHILYLKPNTLIPFKILFCSYTIATLNSFDFSIYLPISLDILSCLLSFSFSLNEQERKSELTNLNITY